MNQWLTENRYRQYPLQVAETSSVPDAVLLDARFWLSHSIASVPAVVLTGMSTTDVTFTVVGTPITLVGSIAGAADGQRVGLTLMNGGTPDPGLGSGWVIVGDVSVAPVFIGSLPVSEVCVRILQYGATVYAVQNRGIAQNTARSQSTQPGDDISIDTLDEVTVTECLQYADEADDDPDNAEKQLIGTVGNPAFGTLVTIPHDPQSVSEYTRYTQTYPTSSITVTDTIPAPVSGPVTVLGTTLTLESGYNLALTLQDGALRLEARLGTGIGYNVLGELDGFVYPVDRADLCVKELAGAIPDESGTITIRAGRGVSVVDSPGSHTVYIIFDLR